MALSDCDHFAQKSAKLPPRPDDGSRHVLDAGEPFNGPPVQEVAGSQQPDAWSVEDWSSTQNFSPMSSDTPTSASSAAQKFDDTHMLADTILAELHVDLESSVQRATNQMSSWVSEEFASSQQRLQESLHSAVTTASEAYASQVIELQRLNIELRTEFEQLRSTCGQNLVTTQKALGDCKGSVEDADALDLTSVHVMEARMFADERRWRMKMDSIDNTFGKHLESIDMLGKQLTLFASKFAHYDVELRENCQSIQRIDAQLKAASEKERADARVGFETHLEMIESLRRQCTALETRVADCDVPNALHSLNSRCSMADAESVVLKADLKGCMEGLDRLNERVSKHSSLVHTTNLCKSDLAIDGMDARLSSLETSQLEVGKHFSSLAEQVKRLELKSSAAEAVQLDLGKQAGNLAEQASQLANTMQSSAEAVDGLEQKLTAAETSQLEAQSFVQEQIQALSAAIAAQIDAAEQMQAQISADEHGFRQSLEEMFKQNKGIRTQLQSKIDATYLSNALTTIHEVTRRLADTSMAAEKESQRHASQLKVLTEEISGRASTTEVEAFRIELKAWVENACETHQTTVSNLSQMFDQVRGSSKAQNDILEDLCTRVHVLSQAVVPGHVWQIGEEAESKGIPAVILSS